MVVNVSPSIFKSGGVNALNGWYFENGNYFGGIHVEFDFPLNSVPNYSPPPTAFIQNALE